MKSKWIYAALLTGVFAIPATAEVSIYIGVPPPAIVYEVRAPAPAPEYIWIEGYWIPAGRHYRWCRGHWERPPYEGAAWVQPRYDREEHGWRYREGHWDHGHHKEWKHGRGHGHGHDRD